MTLLTHLGRSLDSNELLEPQKMKKKKHSVAIRIKLINNSYQKLLQIAKIKKCRLFT